MNAMTTKFAKMLALMPVVALAAACNGVAPTTPSDVLADATGADGNATAMTTSPAPCPGVSGIGFQIVQSDTRTIWVEASYQYVTQVPAPVACAAPAWTSDRQGLQIDGNNRFRAGFPRSMYGVANLTATARNGVRNHIRMELGSGRIVADDSCSNVTGVSLKIVPSTTGENKVRIEAAYLSFGPGLSNCAAPAWSADRAGLRVEANPFRAVIGTTSMQRTSVTATAPNGISGRIRF